MQGEAELLPHRAPELGQPYRSPAWSLGAGPSLYAPSCPMSAGPLGEAAPFSQSNSWTEPQL